MTPIPDDTILDTLAIWVSHVKNTSIFKPSHLSKIQFMERSSSCVRVVTLCLDPTKINSVFKTFKVNLFAISQIGETEDP